MPLQSKISKKNKTLAFSDYIISNTFDIIAVTETWLGGPTDKVCISELVPSGYKITHVPGLKTSTFLDDEWPEFLAGFTAVENNIIVVGDVNFHPDIPSNPNAAKLQVFLKLVACTNTSLKQLM